MVSTNQLHTKVRSMNSAVVDYYNLTGLEKSLCKKNSSFSVMDSNETAFSSTIPFKTKDAALVYVDKGELTVIHDSKTYKLSDGMLLVKTPDMILKMPGCNDACHFKVVAFTSQFGIASGIPIKHLETIALMASSNPVLTLDTSEAATC